MPAEPHHERMPFNEALKALQQRAALDRYQKRGEARSRTTRALQTRSPFSVDTPERASNRRARIDERDGLSLERIIGKSDLFPVSYLEAGLRAAKSVCRIEVRDRLGRVLGHGTGFLVSRSLLLTNHHVLDTGDRARWSLAQFNHETDLRLLPRPIQNFRLDPERFFMADEGLDFSIVAVGETSAEGAALGDFGYLPLNGESGKALLGEYVSIVQHPSGAPKAVSIRENEVTDVFENYVHYATDTEPGSSGSPVFSDAWEVVALHHAGVPDPGDPSRYVANEGVRVSSIMRYLSARREGLSVEERGLLEALLTGAENGPGPGAEPPAAIMLGELGREWYEGLSGYDPGFLGEAYPIPFPEANPETAADIARLENGKEALDYTHFSVVMKKSRKLALFTAVNIDGAGLVKLERKKDRWFFDPRLDRELQSGPELYHANDLDRGHLVRRLDPVWGEVAQKANEDTFHFTNCSPQHKHLNQKTWLGLEDYILKNAGSHDLRVTVFTGPVFREDDRLYRGTFQIPAEFWKIAAMVKPDGRLSATAYLQTQKNLIDDLEFAFGAYKTYQVPVSMIGSLTGLDFGTLTQHDPLARIEAVMARAIGRPEDIRL